jgi:hypothetical protein
VGRRYRLWYQRVGLACELADNPWPPKARRAAVVTCSTKLLLAAPVAAWRARHAARPQRQTVGLRQPTASEWPSLCCGHMLGLRCNSSISEIPGLRPLQSLASNASSCRPAGPIADAEPSGRKAWLARPREHPHGRRNMSATIGAGPALRRSMRQSSVANLSQHHAIKGYLCGDERGSPDRAPGSNRQLRDKRCQNWHCSRVIVRQPATPTRNSLQFIDAASCRWAATISRVHRASDRQDAWRDAWRAHLLESTPGPELDLTKVRAAGAGNSMRRRRAPGQTADGSARKRERAVPLGHSPK